MNAAGATMAGMTDLTDHLTTAEVADELGVHRMTVQRMVKSGALVPAYATRLGPLFDPAVVRRES